MYFWSVSFAYVSDSNYYTNVLQHYVLSSCSLFTSKRISTRRQNLWFLVSAHLSVCLCHLAFDATSKRFPTRKHESRQIDRCPIFFDLSKTLRTGAVNHSSLLKGTVRRKIFYLILILLRSTFHMRKNSVLTKSISHHVPEIFRFL